MDDNAPGPRPLQYPPEADYFGSLQLLTARELWCTVALQDLGYGYIRFMRGFLKSAPDETQQDNRTTV